MRISRFSRQGVIYDASTSAGTFTEREIEDSQNDIGAVQNSQEEEKGRSKIIWDLEHMPGYR